MAPILVVSPEIELRIEYVRQILAENKLAESHPNLLWLGEEEKLGVEAAKKIREHLSLKPYQGTHQAVVIIKADNLTPESQNSLLKTLEEPAEDAIIILGTSFEEQLLTTLLSRCQVVRVLDEGSKIEGKFKKKIEKLLSESTEEKFVFIEKLEEKEKFLEELITHFREMHHHKPSKQLNQFLADLILAQKWAQANVNLRAILEYLMLRMPFS